MTLGGDRRPLPSCPGFYVRINDAVTSSVVFLGVATDERGKGGIECAGTGFLVGYDGVGYLVTARHVAKDLNNFPFRIRLNRPDGTSGNIDADQVQWAFHEDDNVDLAAIVFHIGSEQGYKCIYLPHTMIIDFPLKPGTGFGIGDLCYAVGLFRVMHGQTRNLPVVHSGNLALLPDNEKIPVLDWDDPEQRRVRHVEGYLVELQSLSGLSGSPVFCRPVVDSVAEAYTRTDDGKLETQKIPVRMARHDIYLMGIWQAAWDAPPSEVMAMEHGRGIQVPVGMGVVVPAYRLLELLNKPELAMAREQRKKALEEQHISTAAAPRSALRRVKSEPPATADNPSHKEDFTSLLNAAAKKKQRDD
jgi:hypothetical protein